MKYLKMLGLAAVAAMSFMAFAAGSASATTLEVNGVTQNQAVTITASADTSITLARTDGSFANTCTESHVHGETESPFTAAGEIRAPLTGHKDGRPASSGLSFGKCTNAVTVHKPGTLDISHIASTTNGTVFSEEAEWTTGSPFGTLNCKTGETTHIGTLTGVDGTPATHATAEQYLSVVSPS